MVYAGKVKGKKRTLGVSGRLMKSNLVMFDEETDSLWSQILGEALHGKAKGERLDMLPAVFVGFGTWKRKHPKTKVLDLELVRARSWHFTTDDLDAGFSMQRGRKLELGIGLRHGKDTLLVPMSLLHKKQRIETSVAGIPLELVWDAKEKAAFVYRMPKQEAPSPRAAPKSRPLPQPNREPFPYLPTYLSAWKRYYPKGRVYAEKPSSRKSR